MSNALPTIQFIMQAHAEQLYYQSAEMIIMNGNHREGLDGKRRRKEREKKAVKRKQSTMLLPSLTIIDARYESSNV